MSATTILKARTITIMAGKTAWPVAVKTIAAPVFGNFAAPAVIKTASIVTAKS